jgi:hypothetical protein
MDVSTKSLGNAFPFWWPWPAAPSELSQPILPGWTFGNVTVNEQNSSAPATEREIVAEESYGRQIGKLLDAVATLIAERGNSPQPEALTDLIALQTRVDEIKTRAAKRRLDQVQQDLRRLKDHDRVAYDAQVESFRQLLSGD